MKECEKMTCMPPIPYSSVQSPLFSISRNTHKYPGNIAPLACVPLLQGVVSMCICSPFLSPTTLVLPKEIFKIYFNFQTSDKWKHRR